jgi:hypothetical protein
MDSGSMREDCTNISNIYAECRGASAFFGAFSAKPDDALAVQVRKACIA